MMKRLGMSAAVFLLGGSMATSAWADNYTETIDLFRGAVSSSFFDNSYGYAVFPNIGKGGMGIGGAHGKGQVYEKGVHVGNTTMTQLTVGFQAGGQVYSQIIFFKDQRAFYEFTSGNFEFGAQATAIAITASASAAATTTGTGMGAGSDKDTAKATGDYYKGMAVFTVAKGGLMYEATLGGQKFTYKAVK
jgi:lipid-binding SYLF domain-containing protein